MNWSRAVALPAGVWRRYVELSEADPGLARDILGLYLGQTTKQLEACARAIETGDGAALRLSAHTIRGASLNIGAEAMGDLAWRVERLADEGALEQATLALTTLVERYAVLEPVLAAFLEAEEPCR